MPIKRTLDEKAKDELIALAKAKAMGDKTYEQYVNARNLALILRNKIIDKHVKNQ